MTVSEPSSLQRLLDEPTRRWPEKIAIRSAGVTTTFHQLNALVSRVAAALVASDVAPEDRVAWLLPNGLEALAVTLGCYQVAAIAVPMNVRYAAAEVAYMVSKVKAKMLFLRSCQLYPNLGVADIVQVDLSWTAFLQRGEASAVEPSPRGVAPEAPALILFTSGTTGHPKGVLHSHGGCYAAISTSAATFDVQSADVVLVGKAISHAGGLQTQLLPTLMRGGEVVLAMLPSAAEALQLVLRFEVTIYAMLASSLLDFVEQLENEGAGLPASLRRVIGSGDSVPLPLQSRFQKLFGWPVLEGCGITEIGGYYAAQPVDGSGPSGAMGQVTVGTEVRLVEDGRDVPSPGCVGEVLLRTPSLPLGYWEDAEATEGLFEDGWLRTGDLAKFDRQGFLWFVGRRKLIIVRRGSNLAPVAVERVLQQHEKVKQVVVVGVPDREDGEVPVAWVVPRAPLTETELQDHVAPALAAYERPVRYWLRDSMPVNSVGKFDRSKLKEEAMTLMASGAGA